MDYDAKMAMPDGWEDHWSQCRKAFKSYGFNLSRRGNTILFTGKTFKIRIKISGKIASFTVEEYPFFLTKSMIIRKAKEILKNCQTYFRNE